jgi:hypothetical protein
MGEGTQGLGHGSETREVKGHGRLGTFREEDSASFLTLRGTRPLGTLRQECVDFVIPLTDNHLRRLLSAWVQHDNHGRPHMALGPGIPQPPAPCPVARHTHRHRIPPSLRVVARPILGGLHHAYGLEAQAA